MAEKPAMQDPFEMFRRLWGPLGLPAPGMAMPTLDPQEIEKRVSELRSVESWLSMNLNMVRFSIEGLELQKAALNAVRAAGAAGSQAPFAAASSALSDETAAGVASAAASSLFWPWAMMQQAMSAGAAPQGTEPRDEKPPGNDRKP